MKKFNELQSYLTRLRGLMLTLIVLFSWGSVNVWGAEGDTHDFSQSLQQLLNNNASISSINIAAQSYPVKEVIISFRYNNTITNAVTMEVFVGGSSWGTAYSEGTKTAYKTRSFTDDATTGAIVINFTNNTGSGTGHGTFYVNNVRLVEGAASDPHTVTLMDTGETLTEASAGAGVTLPSRASCTGYTFAGWTASWNTDQTTWTTTAPSIINAGAYSPSSNINLYPVYTKTEGGGSNTVTFTPGTETGATSVTKSGVTCTMTTMNNASYYQIYADQSGTISVSSGNITGISFTCTASGTSKYGPGNASFNVGTFTYSGSNGSWTGEANSVTISTTVQIRMSALSVTCSASSTTYYISVPNCCSDPGLAYGTASVTKTFGASAFTNTLTNSHSVAVTYTSSDPTVATVNGSGQVTILKVGTTTITASSIAQTVAAVSYCADEASYTLTVNKANITPTLTYSPASVAVGENSATPTVGGNTGSGGVTYAITSASPAGCATINTNTGVVSGVAVGSVTVTATIAATTNYNGNTATATVTITSASNFPNNKTIFIQAHSTSAWTGGGCVKAWFHSYGGSEGAQSTYWLFDAGSPDEGKKLFAAIVPSTGNLPYLDIQRFASNCNDWWNKNGGCSYADANGSNAIRSTGKHDDGSDGDYIRWNNDAVTLGLRGDPDWNNDLATFADQGNGVWTATYNNYAPANAAGESQEFKICTNYNGWIGNSGSNNNVTVDGMHVGSTYNIGATLDIKDHSLVMSKTFVKGTVHFNLQSHGSAISDLTNVTANSKISAPTVPTDANYIFGGWYKEPGCTNAWDFTNDVVTETMTLYAKWYQVTLAVKDEDGTTLSGDGKPTLTRSGASLTATEAGNYAFKDIQVTSGTGALSSTSSLTPTITSVSTNITITATFWKPITVTKGTGTGTSTFTISATTVARGGSVTVTCAPDATHKNPWTLTVTPSDGATYTASASTGSTTISNITKNITVDLSYASKETYTLTFSTKSGYGSPSGGKIDETNLSFNGSGTVTNPLVEGQTLTFPSVSSFAADECSTTFEGWSTNPSCATAPTIKAGDELVLSGASGSTTYYAVYSQVEEGGGDDFDPSEDVDGDFYITNSDKSYYMSHSNPSVSQYDATIAASKSASTNLFHISKIASGDNAGKFIISFDVSGTTNYVRVYRQSVNGSWKYYVNHTTTAAEATALIIQATAREGATGTFEATYDNTRALMYRNNDGAHSFRNYALTNASATGYSLLEFEPAASKTYTTNPTCTETFTVTLTGGEGASVDVTGGNVKYNGGTAARFAENDAVSISATPATGYSFTGWTITKEGGGSVTPASSAASTTFTMPADNVTVTATFSPILVSSLKLRAQQTGQSDKTGSDLTMNCYPKEGQTGGNDPLSHTLNVAFYEVLPADALDKTYTWSVRVKVSGAADWTNVDFTGNQLNTNAIINYYNNNTGLLKIGTNEGTAEIKITANDASGVSAKVTITVAKVSVTSISVDPTSMNVYAGQKKPVTITFTPLNASDKAYTTGSYSYVTIRSSGSNPFYIEGNATEVVRNETVTVTSHDGSHTATIAVTVNPLPKATFVDIVQDKNDFDGVPSTGILSSTVDDGGLTVTTTKNTPTHADVAEPATGNPCEKSHLHLVGWILKDWADENPDATSAQIAAAGAGNFYAAGSEIDLVAKDGKTFYAVWAKEVTNP